MGIFGGHTEKPPADEPAALKENQNEAPKQNDGVLMSDMAEAQLAAKNSDIHVLTEPEAYDKLGFCYPTWKKWSILCVVFAVQCSMNFNTSIYANGLDGLTEKFNVSAQAARCGQMLYLVWYGIGSELWAPWSEDYGRWPVMQLSLFLVNIWQIPCALAPNFGTLLAFRSLGGLSSAGGSVTLGMVADMWQPDDQGYAVAFVVFSSVGGSVLGPIIGPIVAAHAPLIWIFWVQLIFGGVVQLAHFFCPETRSTILLDREAKRRRKAGETNVYGPNEVKEKRISGKELVVIWTRPFIMLLTEPIVLFLSLLSGFSDALIFTFFESFGLVYGQWGFTGDLASTLFVCIIIGYLIAYGLYVWKVFYDNKKRRLDPDSVTPETRLYLLLWLAPLEPLGLFGFAWTSGGPSQNHWFGPMFFCAWIAIANLAIYQATIDYMVAAYGAYSSSATGGNAFCRDVLAGISALYAVPLYTNLSDSRPYGWGSTLLAFLAILVVIPIYVVYWKGPAIRSRSKFALSLADEREAKQLSRKDMEKGNRAEATHQEQA